MREGWGNWTGLFGYAVQGLVPGEPAVAGGAAAGFGEGGAMLLSDYLTQRGKRLSELVFGRRPGRMPAAVADPEYQRLRAAFVANGLDSCEVVSQGSRQRIAVARRTALCRTALYRPDELRAPIRAALAVLALFEAPAGFWAAAVVFGLGFGVSNPALAALSVEVVPADQRGSAIATYVAGFELGIGTGSIAFGPILQSSGFTVAFLIAAATPVLGTILYVVTSGARRPSPHSPEVLPC